VVSPAAAFMSAGMGTQALSLAEKNAWLDHLHRSFTYIGQHLEDPSITFTAGGTEKIGDVQAAVLEIDGAVPSVRWYVDPQSSRVLRENFKTVSESGTFNTDVKLSDWRTVEGLVLPFAINSKTNRQTTTSECDGGYQGQGEAIRQAAARAQDTTKRRVRYKDFDELQKAKNRVKARVRAKVEHPFRILKRIFGFEKVRYRGIKKNHHRLCASFALVNLYLHRRRLALARA
jgi:Transposase DDE domain